MGVKQLHAIANRFHCYQQHDNVLQLLDEHNVNTMIIDFCPTFFDLLAEYGVRILPGHLEAQGGYRLVQPDIGQLVDECIQRIENLNAPDRRIILVIDGEAHPIKKKTHTKRDMEAKKAFDRAKAEYRRLNGVIEGSENFTANARKWLRFTPEIKNSIMMRMLDQNIPRFEFPVSGDLEVVPQIPNNPICFIEAPFEADGLVVSLTQLLGPEACMVSVDGDLLAYGGCLDTLRLMGMNWETGVVNRYCIKRQFINNLGLHLQDDENYVMAEKFLLVLASVSGNDYADNIPTYSFGKMRERLLNALQLNRTEYWNQSLYAIQQRILSTFNNLPTFIADRMMMALVMYACPLVDITNNRGWSPLDIGIENEQLFAMLAIMEEPRRLRGPTEVQQNRFTLAYNVNTVPRDNTAPEYTGDLRPQRNRMYARAARGRGRARGGRARGGRRGGGRRGGGRRGGVIGRSGRSGMAGSITIPSDDNNAGEHVTIAAKSRAIRTWSIGLYSTVLSAAMTRAIPFNNNNLTRFQMNFDPIEQQSIAHTRLICDILHNEAKQMSFVRQVAFQIANIALRHAYEYPLSEQRRINFFKEFFSNNSDKVWKFIINCAMARNIAYHRAGDPTYNEVPFHPLQADRVQTGIPSVGNPRTYTAHAADNSIYLNNTIDMLHDNPDFRNVVLEARVQWYQYYRDNDIVPPALPNASYRVRITESLASQMNTCFKVNFIEHFLSRTQAYISAALSTIADRPMGWPEVPEILREGVENYNDQFYTCVLNAINAPAPVNLQNQLQQLMEQQNAEDIDEVIASVLTFVTAQRNKRVYMPGTAHMDFANMQDELGVYAKRPHGWPVHSGLPQYILANVFYIPWMNRDERTENIVNDDVCREVHEQVLGCLPIIQRDIREFIRDIRVQLQAASYGWMIGVRIQPIPPNTADDITSKHIPLDIFDCMDLPRPSLISRVQHLFVDVMPEDPQFIAWEQNLQQHWQQRLQQSMQYVQNKLRGIMELWNEANRLTQVIEALPDNQQPIMLEVHNNEFDAEWEQQAHDGLNRNQRLENMMVLLIDFFETTKQYMHDIILDEIAEWLEVWVNCKNLTLELRDVLFDENSHRLLETVRALEDHIEGFQGEINEQWRIQAEEYNNYVQEASSTISNRYHVISDEILEILPLNPDGQIVQTPEVQREYNFWMGILQESYNNFEEYCARIQQPVYIMMMQHTTTVLQELEAIHLAANEFLINRENELNQAEEEDEEEDDSVELDIQFSDQEDEEDIVNREDDDPPTTQGSSGFRTHALIPMLAMMLNNNQQLSFSLCPKGRSGNICIPINRKIGRDILQNIDYFAQGLPNYADLGHDIQTLQQCVTYSRLVGCSETPFTIPLSTPTRAIIHDMIMGIIDQLINQQPVNEFYTLFPDDIEITNIPDQMNYFIQQFQLVGGFVNDELVYPQEIQICALYGSQLYCGQQLLIRMLRIRTLIRSRVFEMQEPPMDINVHGWRQPQPIVEADLQRMIQLYNRYYPKTRLHMNDFLQAYLHCYNRMCWENIVARQYNDENPLNPLSSTVIGHYLDQWQSANIYGAAPNQLDNFWNPYPFFFNPQYQSFVSANGDVTIKHSRFYREFSRTIQGVDMVYPRYTIDRLMTDGVRMLVVVRDWNKRFTRSRGNPIKYIPEVRKRRMRDLAEDPEHRTDLAADISDINAELDQRVDLMQQNGFTGVIGVDLGETFAAGTFYLPFEHNVGVQHTIRRKELYGMTFTNRGIMESEKRASGVNEIESMLSLGSTYSNLERYRTYIQNFQVNNNGLNLNNFYSRRSFIRRGWSNRLSIKAAKDKACMRVLSMHDVSLNAPTQIAHRNQALERRQTRDAFDAIRLVPWADEAILNAQILEEELQSQNEAYERRQARIQRRALMTPQQQVERQIAKRLKRQRQRHRPPPTRMVVALGMDALTSGNHRRGAPASMDMSFASQLVQVAKARDHLVVRCDEFKTSKLCPRCSMLGRVTELHFLTVQVPGPAQPRQSIRVLVCDTCNKFYHRDGSAAHNIASNAMAVLQFGQRIPGNIRYSRRIPGVQYGNDN